MNTKTKIKNFSWSDYTGNLGLIFGLPVFPFDDGLLHFSLKTASNSLLDGLLMFLVVLALLPATY